MNIERDKFLTEQMGECWHEEFEEYNLHGEIRMRCRCGKTALKEYCCIRSSGFKQKYNFSTWEGFGKLWEWAQKQDWWCEFEAVVLFEHPLGYYWLIHPDHFADAVYEYLKERGE